MSEWSFHLDPPDLIAWIWLAVLLAAMAELIRYLAVGRWPAGIGSRLAVAVAIVVGVGCSRAAGLLRSTAGGHGVATLLLGLLATVWVIRAYRQTTRNLGKWERRTLLAIRLAAVAVVLLLLAGPVFRQVSLSRKRTVLAVLLDDSKSMRVRDVRPEGVAGTAAAATRLEAVQQTLKDNADALDGLAADVDIRWFTFAKKIREATEPEIEGQGEQTALAGGLERVRELLGQASGGKPAGVIVISDGRDNLSSDEERRSAGSWLVASGVPLYCVGVGNNKPTGDARGLQIRRLDCPPSVAMLNRLATRAELSAAGLAGTPITVELWFDEQMVDRREVQAGGSDELLQVELAYTPVVGGLHRVSVQARAAGVAGSDGQANLSQFVRVTDDKIQVLYIDRPRYERAAVARALEAAKELRVTKVDLNRTEYAAAGPLPQSPEEWRAYHVVLIGDVNRESFPAAGLRAIRDLVIEQGHGVAMLGGVRTLGGGQYGRTPLADVLPVDISAVGQLTAPVKFELTPAGQRHPICRMAPEAMAAAAIWKKLPAFDGAGRLSGVRSTAETLLRTPEAAPLLVVSETGKGRTAAVAFDSTWRWSYADDKGLEAQRRFWRQLVLWLANRRPEVWVAADRPRYDLVRLGSGVDKVVLQAGVTDPTTGRAPEQAKLSGSLIGQDGKSHEIRWVRSGDVFEAGPAITEPGEYRVKVSAGGGEQQFGESETAFVVAAADPEMTDTTADLDNLQRLAARTRGFGGEYVPIGQFKRLLERVTAKPQTVEIKRVRRHMLAEEWAWGWLVILVGLLTAEWIIRRWRGLV